MATMDGVPIDNFPVHLPWVRIEKLPGEQVSVLLMAIQVIIITKILLVIRKMFIKIDFL